ncbi:MAG: M28 family peptidase [Gemmatimonadaceae bacterium]
MVAALLRHRLIAAGGVATLLCGAAACSSTPAARAPDPVAAERVAADRVSLDRIRDVTVALTDPRMEGRSTGTSGGERAAQYLAAQFARLGLRPASGATSLLQSFPLYRASVDSNGTVLRSGAVTLRFGTEFVPAGDGVPSAADAHGPIVFVGYGIRDSASTHDDLDGIDVRGKIVIVVVGRPTVTGETAPTGWMRSIGASSVRAALVENGAAAILLVDRWPPSRYEAMARASGGSALQRDSTQRLSACPVVIVSEAGAERLFEGSGRRFSDAYAAAARGEVVTRTLNGDGAVTVRLARERLAASNVVATMPGSDAALAGEAVVFMAHHDAFGFDDAGRIRAGAADNALGTAMLVAIADAIVSSGTRPRRTLIFLSTTGEERGMLGALHWSEHPSVPLDHVVAALNFDGIGTEVYGPVRRVVGFGAELSTLGDHLANAEALLGLTSEADPFGVQKPFMRSDHIVLARRGVPSLMLLGMPGDSVAISMRRAGAWIASAYHTAGDTIRNDWDWRGPRDLARLTLVTGLRVANATSAPVWRTASPFQRSAISDQRE